MRNVDCFPFLSHFTSPRELNCFTAMLIYVTTGAKKKLNYIQNERVRCGKPESKG